VVAVRGLLRVERRRRGLGRLAQPGRERRHRPRDGRLSRVARMCCGVIEMLARYQGLQADRGWDWGDDRIEMFRWARFAALGDVFATYGETGDWAQAVRAVVGTEPPAGIAVVRVRDGGVTVHCGPPRPVVAGVPTPLDVVVDADREVAVVVAGEAFTVVGAGIATVDVDGPPAMTVDGAPVSLADAVAPT